MKKLGKGFVKRAATLISAPDADNANDFVDDIVTVNVGLSLGYCHPVDSTIRERDASLGPSYFD